MNFRLVISLMFVGFAIHAFAWDLDKNQDGIKIYTRKPEESNFKEYKAITTVNINRKKVVEMVLDVDEYINWF